jgi:hypothetical protein
VLHAFRTELDLVRLVDDLEARGMVAPRVEHHSDADGERASIAISFGVVDGVNGTDENSADGAGFLALTAAVRRAFTHRAGDPQRLRPDLLA